MSEYPASVTLRAAGFSSATGDGFTAEDLAIAAARQFVANLGGRSTVVLLDVNLPKQGRRFEVCIDMQGRLLYCDEMR